MFSFRLFSQIKLIHRFVGRPLHYISINSLIYLSKRKVKNIGQLPQYLVEDHHEAIIDCTAFSAVQAEIARRAAWHQPNPRPPATYPLSGMVKCGICGAAYRHKIAGSSQKYKKPVWICDTFNTRGKAACPSQQVPEDILTAKTQEAGGLDGLFEIQVPGHNCLSFLYKDGRQVDLAWQHPSRAQSWTPEMKQAAREKSLQQRGHYECQT